MMENEPTETGTMITVIAAILTVLFRIAMTLAILIPIVVWIWNLVIPDIFGLSNITYWQAVGLYYLIFFLSFKAHGTKNIE